MPINKTLQTLFKWAVTCSSNRHWQFSASIHFLYRISVYSNEVHNQLYTHITLSCRRCCHSHYVFLWSKYIYFIKHEMYWLHWIVLHQSIWTRSKKILVVETTIIHFLYVVYLLAHRTCINTALQKTFLGLFCVAEEALSLSSLTM